MTPLRSLALALPVTGLLLAGCTGSPSPSSSGPPTTVPTQSSASATPTTGAVAPPASRTPVATTRPVAPAATTRPAAALRNPDLGTVRDCPGCTVAAVRHRVRPGISAALLLGPTSGSPYVQRAVIVAYRSTTGRVLGQQAVPDGEYFLTGAQPAATLPCDTLAHCFVIGSVGAHGGTAAAFAIGATGSVGLLVALTASHPTFTVPDLDRDGGREIVAVQSDCDPACAAGHRFWQVHRWATSARAYVLAGCAPVPGGDPPADHPHPRRLPLLTPPPDSAPPRNRPAPRLPPPRGPGAGPSAAGPAACRAPVASRYTARSGSRTRPPGGFA